MREIKETYELGTVRSYLYEDGSVRVYQFDPEGKSILLDKYEIRDLYDWLKELYG